MEKDYKRYVQGNYSDVPIITFDFVNKFNGVETEFDYQIPYEAFVETVVDFIEDEWGIKVDGKINSIWNCLVDVSEHSGFEIIDEFLDNKKFQEMLKERLEEEAKEKFDEICEEELEDEDDADDEEDDEDKDF